MSRFKTSDLFLYAFLALQILLWTQTKQVKPEFTIVPDVPSEHAVKALSLGDEAFYFRNLAYQLQNAGDSFGRFTALKDYNYEKLYAWFTLLDTLDSTSNFIPALAGYYYSQTQNIPDTRYVIDYLEQHAERDLYNKWWWMSQAVYLANYRLEDKELALKLAKKLAATPRDDIPLWTKQMPAFILERMGELEQALYIIDDVNRRIQEDKIPLGEVNFMLYFLKERLEKIKNHPRAQEIVMELEELKKHKLKEENREIGDTK